MPGEDSPAQHKSSETVTYADVQRLINQLLRFPLTSEHDDAPNVLEGAVQLARSSAQAGTRPFLVGGGGYCGDVRHLHSPDTAEACQGEQKLRFRKTGHG
jgi:hypothetical protein